MDFMSLPLDIISAVVDEVVRSCEIRHGLHLRCINRSFDREILRAYFRSGIVDFHTDAPNTKVRRPDHLHGFDQNFNMSINSQARRLSKVNAARLLYGRLDALEGYGPEVAWLCNLKSAVRLFNKARHSRLAESCTYESHRLESATKETSRMLCDAVTEYLGVSEIIDSLDPGKQELCCEYHYLPVYDKECRGEPSERLKCPRRQETVLDWAILIAVYTGDLSMIHQLLDSSCAHRTASIILSASLQYSARVGNQVIIRMLLNAGADVNSIGHAGSDFVDDNRSWDNGTPLEAACSEGHMNAVKILFDPRYGIETSGYKYETAIILAARSTNFVTGLEIVRFLIERATSWVGLRHTTREIFEIACKTGSCELGKLVFENAPFDLFAHCCKSDSLLSRAVEAGQIKMAAYILTHHQHCADSFVDPGRELRRAILLAFKHGQTDIAALLWDKLDPISKSRIPSIAARSGYTSMIEQLFAENIDLSFTQPKMDD